MSAHCTRVQGGKFAKADKAQLAATFTYLEGCLEQIVKDNELGALKQALKVCAGTTVRPAVPAPNAALPHACRRLSC